jgi:hypothetical protein
VTTDPVIVDARYCGPPGMGNGGYVGGRLAVHLDPAGAAEVTLRRPTPLGVPLTVQLGGEIPARLMNGTELIAEAVPLESGPLDGGPGPAGPDDGYGVLGSPPPPPVPVEQAREAGRHAVAREHPETHPFPGCFACGPGRSAADGGLCIIPGPVPGRDNLLADVWCPAADLADDAGRVRPEFVWAALDCTGGLGAIEPGLPPYVLGRLKVRPLGPVLAGQPHVAAGWLLAVGGRKIASGSALYTASGKAVAVALGTWLPLPSGPGPA